MKRLVNLVQVTTAHNHEKSFLKHKARTNQATHSLLSVNLLLDLVIMHVLKILVGNHKLWDDECQNQELLEFLVPFLSFTQHLTFYVLSFHEQCSISKDIYLHILRL